VIAGLGIIVGVGLGCSLFYASIMVIRKSLVMIANSKSFWQTAIFPLVNCVPFLLLYGISYAFVVLLPQLSDNATILAMILLFAAWYTNLVFVLTAFLFFLVSAFLLTHKLVWGFVDRPIYALQELGVAKRTKLLGTIGALLLIGAIGGADWLEKVVEKLNPF
jgi:hypothetical protein